MTVNVVITKLENVEKMKVTVIKIVNVNLVLFVARIIVPLEVEVISNQELIAAQNHQVLLGKITRFMAMHAWGSLDGSPIAMAKFQVLFSKMS